MKITYKSGGGVDIDFEDIDSYDERKIILSAIEFAKATILITRNNGKE